MVWTLVFFGSAFVSCITADHYTMDVLVAMYIGLPLAFLKRERLVHNFGEGAVCGLGFGNSRAFKKWVDDFLSKFDY